MSDGSDSHDGQDGHAGHDNTATLVRMANQIAAAFRHEPEARAVAAIAEHVGQFWTRVMRERILGHLAAGGAGLSPLALAGLARLRARRTAA